MMSPLEKLMILISYDTPFVLDPCLILSRGVHPRALSQQYEAQYTFLHSFDARSKHMRSQSKEHRSDLSQSDVSLLISSTL
jgi:hypothetical protein